MRKFLSAIGVFLLAVIIVMSGCVENLVDNSIEETGKNISGIITDTQFNRAVPNVLLKLTPGNYESATDSLGHFEFKNLPVGKYELSTENEYFFPDTIPIDLTYRNYDTLSISLCRRNDYFTKLRFEFREGYSAYNTVEDPFIILNMETEKIYGCMNYQIISETSISNKSINVEFKGVSLGSICYTALGPAKSTSSISIANGKYQLNIKQYDIIDSYSLIVEDSSISVITDYNNLFTTPINYVYWRYPKNSFAIISGTSKWAVNIYNEFFSMLKDSVQITEISFPNYGSLCYPRESMGYQIDYPGKYYKYQNESNFEKLGVLLKNFSDKYALKNTGIGIWIINWRNINYYSWN